LHDDFLFAAGDQGNQDAGHRVAVARNVCDFHLRVGLWLVYGIAKADKALIAANVVTLGSASLILWVLIVNELKSK
jgi:hypothetical protein